MALRTDNTGKEDFGKNASTGDQPVRSDINSASPAGDSTINERASSEVQAMNPAVQPTAQEGGQRGTEEPPYSLEAKQTDAESEEAEIDVVRQKKGAGRKKKSNPPLQGTNVGALARETATSIRPSITDHLLPDSWFEQRRKEEDWRAKWGPGVYDRPPGSFVEYAGPRNFFEDPRTLDAKRATAEQIDGEIVPTKNPFKVPPLIPEHFEEWDKKPGLKTTDKVLHEDILPAVMSGLESLAKFLNNSERRKWVNPVDLLAMTLYKNNPAHPERKLSEEPEFVKKIIAEKPRPPLPLSAMLTHDRAANLIQAAFRGYIVRAGWKKRLKLARDEVREWKERLYKEDSAAICLQYHWRRYLAKQNVQHLRGDETVDRLREINERHAMADLPKSASRRRKKASPEEMHSDENTEEWLSSASTPTPVVVVASPDQDTEQDAEVGGDMQQGEPPDVVVTSPTSI